MLQIDKVLLLIKQENWQALTHYFDQLIVKQSQNFNLETHWLTDYLNQKLQIISLLRQTYAQNLSKSIQLQEQNDNKPSFHLSSFQESVIKLFSKGLMISNFSNQQDLHLLTQIIKNTKNSKYLFILHQENICEVKLIYDNPYCTDSAGTVHLKLLFASTSFIQKLFGQVIFSDLVQQIVQFYNQCDKAISEQSSIEQSHNENKEIKQFANILTQNTIENLETIFKQQNGHISFEILRQKTVQRTHLFQLIKLIYSGTEEETKKQKTMNLLNLILSNLKVSLTEIPQIPSFWVSSNLEQIKLIYSPKQTLYMFGWILIQEIPNKPQHFNIPPHIFPVLHTICYQIFTNTQPYESLSVKDNSQFFTHLFQRFSILMGLLNRQKQNQNQILGMLNAIFNKKNLFSSAVLVSTLWTTLIQKHEDMNFLMFTMGQYKKILTLGPKQLHKNFVHIITHAYKTIFKLVSKLEPNSNAEFIGFHVTLTIYLISCINKVSKYFLFGQGNGNKQHRMLFEYFLNESKTKEMKESLRELLTKLKEGLKDRLEVYKMKNKSGQMNEQQEKQANQVVICIYRIEQEVNFD